MSRKLLYNLRGRVVKGVVNLSFFKSTPFFTERADLNTFKVRIYRKETDFEFNLDYEEYFDGLLPEAGDLIYEGSMEAVNDRKFEFTDTDVKIGSTYAYWASLNRGDSPVGPIALKVRDPEVWWPQSEMEGRMEQLANQHPDWIQPEIFGHTIRGRNIRGLWIGNKQPQIAFIGLIHPGESGPELIIPAIERLVNEHGELLQQVGLAILPAVNIDQRERLVQGHPGYLRTNFNGVDVNRNFPAEWETIEYAYGLITSDPDGITYRGQRPGSEPETRAVMDFVRKTKPRCVFSFHSLASICGPTFLTTRFAKEDVEYERQVQPFVEAYTQGFYERQDVETHVRYSSSAGGLATWLYRELGIPGFDLEWDGREESKVSHTDRTTRELLHDYQNRHYRAILKILKEVHRSSEENKPFEGAEKR